MFTLAHSEQPRLLFVFNPVFSEYFLQSVVCRVGHPHLCFRVVSTQTLIILDFLPLQGFWLTFWFVLKIMLSLNESSGLCSRACGRAPQLRIRKKKYPRSVTKRPNKATCKHVETCRGGASERSVGLKRSNYKYNQ